VSDFAIIIPPDAALRLKIIQSFPGDGSVSFAESRRQSLTESTSGTDIVTALVINFPTAAALVLAIKYATPALTAYLKSKYIYIKQGATEIKVSSADDLKAATDAAVALSKAQQPKPPRRST